MVGSGSTSLCIQPTQTLFLHHIHQKSHPVADLTQTVVAVVCQIESIVTSAAIVAWYVVALMHAAAIILQIAFINV